MTELILTSAALGLAGVDPAGLVIALSALAAGARERAVIGFTLVVVMGTALLGTALTFTVGRQLRSFDWSSLQPPDRVGATVEIVLAISMLVWAAVRVRRPGTRPPRPARNSRSGAALLGVGAVFALSAPLDPTFVGLVVLAGRGEPATGVVSAHLVWIVVSQSPLVALVAAVALRRHGRAVAWLQDLLPRARPILSKIGTGTLALVGGLLTVDALWWFVTGRFLLPDPA